MKFFLFSFLFAGIGMTALAFFKFSNKPTAATNISKVPSIDNAGFVVAELFTSQGCSSCPPADNVLRELATQEGVFPLSFHVTYWNRLGWRDTFSQSIFDERQYAYGKRFRLNSVYTPQLVVNGTQELVGSRALNIKNLVQQFLTQTTPYTIYLHKKIEGDVLKINYKISNIAEKFDLNVAVVESGITTQVKQGENGGKTLHHDNVVRKFITTTLSSAQEGFITLPLLYAQHTVVVYLQERGLGKIVAASKLE